MEIINKLQSSSTQVVETIDTLSCAHAQVPYLLQNTHTLHMYINLGLGKRDLGSAAGANDDSLDMNYPLGRVFATTASTGTS